MGADLKRTLGQLEASILVQLISYHPDYYDIVNIEKTDFQSEAGRRLFAAFEKCRRSEKIDIMEISTLSGYDAASILSLDEGVHKFSKENFINHVRLLKEEKIHKAYFKETEKQRDFYLKGIRPDLSKSRQFFEQLDQLGTKVNTDIECETAEEIAELQIPEIDWLIRPIVERFGYALIGAQKGVGKSLLVTQLGLYAAAGKSPFLTDEITIPNPLNVLLIQQEVSLPGMKDRLFKMRSEKVFDLGGRFRQKTTTGAWWNLTKREDYEKLISIIEKYKPDILILDPLYTFYPKELNTSGDISPMMQVLSDLKSNFNLGLIVVHHFSNKEDPDVQRTPVGRFMGHSMIANSADSTIGLDFLHPRYRQQSLPLPFQNYIMVEITTRHGEWPARFALERKEGRLLFEESSIWQDLGRSIIPGQIEDLIEANDGEMLQKDIIRALMNEAKPTTVKRALSEAEKRGLIAKRLLPGKGNPVMWRLLK